MIKRSTISLLFLLVAAAPTWAFVSYRNSQQQVEEKLAEPIINGKVLGDSTTNEQLLFSVNIPAIFKENITAPNVIYSIAAGKGISVTGDQDATIINTGVTSLQGGNGDLVLTAGTGINIDGLTISNTSNIFKTIAVDGQTDISADNYTDSLTFVGSGVTITTDADNDKITFSAQEPDYSQSGWTDNGSNIVLTNTSDTVTVDSFTAGAITADSLTTSGLALAGGLTVTSGNSILPDTDLGSDLGSALKRFNNLYVGNINSNASVSYSGQTTFSYEPTDSTYLQASVIINPTSPASNGQLLGLGVAGYQRVLIDEDGDLVLGYADQVSAPATDYPLDIYGHSGTRKAYIDANGVLGLGGSTGSRIRSDSNGLISILGASAGYGGLNVKDGTANAPGYGFGNYQGLTGMFTTSGKLGFSTNATERLTIDTAGNVGIGVTSPSELFQVSGGTSLLGNHAAVGTTTANPYGSGGGTHSFTVLGNGDNQRGYLIVGTDDGAVSDGTEFGRIIFMEGNSDRPYIAGLGGTSGGGELAFGTGNGSGVSESLRIDKNGNIGIGNTNPESKLQIAGSLYINSGSTIWGRYPNSVSDYGKLTLRAGNVTSNHTTGIEIYGVDNDADLSNSVLLKTSNQSRLIVDDSGNVGIGTTTPNYKLYVAGNIASSSTISGSGLYTTGAVYTGSIYKYPGVTSDFNIHNSAAGYNMKLSTTQAGGTANSDQLYLASTGNVGIGTTTPGQKLDVAGNMRTANGYMTLFSSSNIPYVSSSTGVNLRLTSGGSVADSNGITINSGNVGIGTTSPSSKLHVVTNSLGTTVDDTSGLKLENTTAAAAGAPQHSPLLVLQGSSYDTGVGASKTTKWAVYDSPYSASTGGSDLKFAHSYDGGAFGTAMTLRYQGESYAALTLNGSNSNIQLGTYSNIKGTTGAGLTLTNTANVGNGNADFNLTGIGTTTTAGTMYGLKYSGGKLQLSSGNTAYYPVHITYTVNNTGTTSGATVDGLYVNATETSLTGTTHNLLRLATDGTDKFVVQASGNIGIGTTIPEEQLTTTGNIQLGITNGDRYIYFDNGTVSNSGLRYNSTTDVMEYSDDGSTWTAFSNFGIGTVTSVTNADGTLTISPTNGDVVASLNLANNNTWTGLQTFDNTYTDFAQYIRHAGDTDTYLQFTDDSLTARIGNEPLLFLTESGAQDIVKLGDGGDVDINLNDDVFIEGSSGYLGVGTNSFAAKLNVRATSTEDLARFYDASGNLRSSVTSKGYLDLSDTDISDTFNQVLKINDAVVGLSEVTGGLGNGFIRVGPSGRSLANFISDSSVNSLFSGGIENENYRRFFIAGDGTFYTGSGSAATDTLLGRNTSGGLKISTTLTSAVNLMLKATTSQTADLFQIQSSGGSTGDKFVVRASGNVGIGQASPGSKLVVVGDSGAGVVSFQSYGGATVSMDNWGNFYVNGGGSIINTGGYITGDIISAYQTNTDFNITANGTGEIILQQNSTGNVGIGTATPAQKLDVVGGIKASALGTGAVYSNSGVLTNTDPSDINLKENILKLSDGTLDKLMGLKPVSYTWKSSGDGALGFIAQDVQQIFPELVGHNGDTLGLYTTQFIPVLTKAIQEQQTQINGLSLIETATISAQVAELDERVGLIESTIQKFKDFVDGQLTIVKAYFNEIFADKTHQKELCIGEENNETCLDKSQVDQLLQLIPTETPVPTPTTIQENIDQDITEASDSASL